MNLRNAVLCLLVVLFLSCKKDGADNWQPGPPSIRPWYLDKAQDAAKQFNTTVSARGDTLVLYHEDYTHPIDDSTIYRRQYATPIAREVALSTYFEFWPGTSVIKKCAFDYDYMLNSFMIMEVYAYKPVADTTSGFTHEMGLTRFIFFSRYANNIYSF